LEAAAVFEDVFFGVPIGETEIEDFLGVLIGNTAGPGAEAVDEPRELCERGDLEEMNSSHVAFDPVRVGSVGRDRQECLSHRGELALGL